MKTKFEYGFWFWSHKLTGILTALAEISKYDLSEIEIETMKQELIDTNDELNRWANYCFKGQLFTLSLELAHDAEEGKDMTHIRIQTTKDLKEKLEMLNLFQCLFKRLEIE